MVRSPIASCLVLVPALLVPYAAAATSPDQILRDQQQQLDLQRQELLKRPDIFTAPQIDQAPLRPEPVTASGPCFVIKSVVFPGIPDEWDAWLHQLAKPLVGTCPDVTQMRALIEALTNAVVARGYVTSRVYLPEQNLKAGILRLAVVPGRLGQIQLKNGGSDLSLRAAFPIGTGDILNVRALEQGLEQLNRISSQQATMEIVPAKEAGYSDVVVTRERSKPWTATLGLDDSGQATTGKNQANVGVSADNLIGINDSLSLNWSQDAALPSDPASRADSLSWMLPWGDWTGLVSYSESDYRQQVAGVNQDLSATGHSRNTFLSLSRLLSRNQTSKTELALQLTRKSSRSYLENVEIQAQRQDLTELGLSLTHRHYFGAWVVNGSITASKGIDAWGAMPNTLAEMGGPTARARIYIGQLDLTAPFNAAGQNLRWNTSFKGQYSPDLLLGQEQFSLGSRYTVRGFDDLSLSGNNGYYIRNELAWIVLPPTTYRQSLELYAGLDAGQVSGQTTNWGTATLSGWTAGLRTMLCRGLNLELSHERGLHQPENWSRPAITHFRLTLQY